MWANLARLENSKWLPYGFQYINLNISLLLLVQFSRFLVEIYVFKIKDAIYYNFRLLYPRVQPQNIKHNFYVRPNSILLPITR